MDCKAAETTRNNNVFDPGTANDHTVQWWFNKFCKVVGSLQDEEYSGRPSEVDKNQLRAVIEADPLKTMTLKNSMSTVLGSLAFEANWRGENA